MVVDRLTNPPTSPALDDAAAWKAQIDPAGPPAAIARVAAAVESELRAAYQIRSKQTRQQRLKEIGAFACLP